MLTILLDYRCNKKLHVFENGGKHMKHNFLLYLDIWLVRF